MDQTKESILARVEAAIEKGGEEAIKFFHDGVTTIEAWLSGDDVKGAEDTGSAVQASVDASATDDTPAA